MEACRKHSLRH